MIAKLSLVAALLLCGHFAQADHAASGGGISAEAALTNLEEGNKRFARGTSWHPHQDKKTVDSLATGQHPHTIVVSCSDSRVPPEVIFDQGLGDVFVVRTAGQVLDYSAIASIEYAIAHLGSQLLVVLGHESCGAIGAAVHTEAGATAGSPDLDKLVGFIKPHIASLSIAEDDKKMSDAVKANVNGVSADLLSRSTIVRSAVESKKLTIAQGLYALDTGAVQFWKGGTSPAHRH